jgi:hypothetical protein
MLLLRALLCLALSFALPAKSEPISRAAVSVALHGIKFLIQSNAPKEIVVRVTGFGENEREAVEDALVRSVAQASGVFIVSDVSTDAQKITKDIGIQYASGFVVSHTVEKCYTTLRTSCDVTARVRTKKIQDYLISTGELGAADVSDVYAKAVTSRHALIQRAKLTDYYLKRLRVDGLDARIHQISIRPSLDNVVNLDLSYKVSLRPELKSEVIKFLQQLEADTDGRNFQKLTHDSRQLYVHWGPTGFRENRVYINTFDERYHKDFQELLTKDIEIYIKELELCERLPLKANILALDWYGYERTITLQIPAERLEKLEKLTFQPSGCPAIVRSPHERTGAPPNLDQAVKQKEGSSQTSDSAISLKLALFLLLCALTIYLSRNFLIKLFFVALKLAALVLCGVFAYALFQQPLS